MSDRLRASCPLLTPSACGDVTRLSVDDLRRVLDRSGLPAELIVDLHQCLDERGRKQARKKGTAGDVTARSRPPWTPSNLTGSMAFF